MSVTVRNTAVQILISKKSNHRCRRRRRYSLCFAVGMIPSEKPKGTRSLQLQIDGDKTTITMGIVDDAQSSKKKEFNNFRDKPHLFHPLIAQEFNSSQSVSKGFSSYEHGTINIAYRGEDFICVGVDSKLTKHGEVTSLDYQKFYELSKNIYITMAGSKEPWEIMYKYIASEFLKKSKKHHTVEAAALLAYMFLMEATDADPSLACSVGCLVLGWDFKSSHPQMFRVVAGKSPTKSDSAMALGTGEKFINLQDLTDCDHEKLADASRDTMSLLNRACLLDPYCGGTPRVWVLQRDQPPSCKHSSSFN